MHRIIGTWSMSYVWHNRHRHGAVIQHLKANIDLSPLVSLTQSTTSRYTFNDHNINREPLDIHRLQLIGPKKHSQMLSRPRMNMAIHISKLQQFANSTALALKLHKALSAQEFVTDPVLVHSWFQFACRIIDIPIPYQSAVDDISRDLEIRMHARIPKLHAWDRNRNMKYEQETPQRPNGMGNREFGYHEEITVAERARSGQGGSEGTWNNGRIVDCTKLLSRLWHQVTPW